MRPPFSDTNSPVVVEARHDECDQRPSDDGEGWVDPIKNWVDGNTAVELSKTIGEHVEATHRNHHGPVLLNELHISQHGVERGLQEWNQMEGDHVPSHVQVVAGPAEVREDVWRKYYPKESHNEQVQGRGTLSRYHCGSLPRVLFSRNHSGNDRETRNVDAPVSKVVEEPDGLVGLDRVVGHHDGRRQEEEPVPL